MIRRPPRSTPLYSSAASDVYKRQHLFQQQSMTHLPGRQGIDWRRIALRSRHKEARAASFACPFSVVATIVTMKTIADQRAASCKLAHSSMPGRPLFKQEQLWPNPHLSDQQRVPGQPAKEEAALFDHVARAYCLRDGVSCRYWQKPCPHCSAHARRVRYRQRRHDFLDSKKKPRPHPQFVI